MTARTAADEVEDFRDPSLRVALAAWRFLQGPAEPSTWLIARTLTVRGLGFIYLVAFATLWFQGNGLLWSNGLTPIHLYLRQVAEAYGDDGWLWWTLPTLFWWADSDAALTTGVVAGLLLAVLALLGRANVVTLFALWLLDLSFVSVGQDWYRFGWESMLLELGFLTLFWVPLLRPGPFPKGDLPPAIIALAGRWLLFRTMFGAGLIKLRGDDCWGDLTCLDHFYETQPNPNPLAWYLHHAPHGLLAGGVLLNHFVELIAPFFLFGPRRVRAVAGLVQVGFQLLLIAGGNLSFLNWLTIVICFSCFDDQTLRAIVPPWWKRALARVWANPVGHLPGLGRLGCAWSYTVLVAILSIPIVGNLCSPDQVMNRSYDPFRLVNTYGAFGSVGEDRLEIVIQGTLDDPADARAQWLDYEFPCKPGDLRRRPCQITPYHYRLDWVAWFAGFQSIDEHPWLAHLVWKLLRADPSALALLEVDPFHGRPPRAIRIQRFRYAFSEPGSDAWWTRELVEEPISPTTLQAPEWDGIFAYYGWEDGP